MLISNFINPPDEDQSHEVLTDEEILEAAAVVDHDDGQDEAEAAAPMLYSELSKEKQVNQYWQTSGPKFGPTRYPAYRSIHWARFGLRSLQYPTRVQLLKVVR